MASLGVRMLGAIVTGDQINVYGSEYKYAYSGVHGDGYTADGDNGRA